MSSAASSVSGFDITLVGVTGGGEGEGMIATEPETDIDEAEAVGRVEAPGLEDREEARKNLRDQLRKTLTQTQTQAHVHTLETGGFNAQSREIFLPTFVVAQILTSCLRKHEANNRCMTSKSSIFTLRVPRTHLDNTLFLLQLVNLYSAPLPSMKTPRHSLRQWALFKH
jgi:hypothetical protein